MLTTFLKNTWPLFLGLALLMLGNGLQGTLISWRATFEGFSASSTGWIMTGYYTGFLVGSLHAPKLVNSVGHIRVFAALASLASAAVLLQIIFINPQSWFFMRLITGFCFAGIYVVVESWLNASTNNSSRGQMLSFYMFISYGGLAGGQWLMNIASPSGFELFLLSSILLSIALVPILVSKTQVPEIGAPSSLNISKLYKIAPAGVFAIFVAATAHGAMFGMGAVFAVKAGLAVSELALFMSSFIALGALAQWPLGWLSDRMDRRLVLLGSAILATAFSFLLMTIEAEHWLFYTLFAFLGAVSLPIYSIAVAHTNDRLAPEQMAGASSTLVLIFGIGSILGPTVSGYILSIYNAAGFLFYLGISHAIVAMGMAFYILRRGAVIDEAQTQYHLVPLRSSAIVMEALALEAEESIDSDLTGNQDN